MTIAVIPHDTCTVVQVDGPLNRQTSPELEKTLVALADKGQSQLVLDLSGVPEMSSAGLRTIINATKRLRGGRGDGDLRLAAPGKRVVEVLELAGLLPVFHIFDTADQAVASFEQTTT
jgi:anti-anti-sigma factor